jgi:hypothetical protein
MKATSNTVKRVDYKVVKQEHVLSFDFDNMYPQRVIDIYRDSSTGTLCAKMMANFVMGGGFTDKEFYKSEVNRSGLTVDGLLRKQVKDVSTLGTFAMHVNYNANFEVSEVHFVHVAHLRLGDPNDADPFYRNKIAVYNDWGKVINKKIDAKKIDWIDVFNPNPEAIQKQVNACVEYDKHGNPLNDGWDKYKGQILWFGVTEAWEYVLSVGDPVLEDMQTQGRMKRFKFNNVANNFLASHVFVTGKYEDDQARETFAENLMQFQGDENTAGVMHVELDNPEDTFKIEKVDIQNYDGLYQFTESSAKDSIIQNYLIPSLLVMATPGKLGTSTEIEDATAFYNGITADWRLIFEEVYSLVFGNFHKQINRSGDYSIIPFKAPKSSTKITSEYFPYYTVNEIREANGDQPLSDEQILRL